jgi:hypothetical protein
MSDAFDHINFNGRDWGLMKQYLEDQKRIAVDILCAPNTGQDETNSIRGRILFINLMLKKGEFLAKEANSQ